MKIETHCLLWVSMAQFLRFNAEAQRKERWWGVCLQSGFLGDRPRESIANRVFGYWQKFFSKKFVIACHWMHTFTWLNLLLEPKRLLQRFGFVFLGDVAFAVLATKNRRGRREAGGGEAEGVWGRPSAAKIFLKKFVIGCHWVHTFTWLNLLLEPKRHLQRFGFVFLWDASFCGFSHKGLEN